MATYQDQIKSSFDTNIAAWKSSQQIYDAMKAKLATNPTALSTLDTYYKSLAPSAPISRTGLSPQTNTPAPVQTNITPSIVRPPASVTPTVVREPSATNSFDSQIKNAFTSYTSAGKTPQQVYEAMKTKLASNPTALASLETQYAAMNPTNPNVASMAGRKNVPGSATKAPIVTPNSSNKTVNTAGMDKDTAATVTNQVNTINQEYDDKIKTHDAYAKTISDALDKNAAEFQGKYDEQRANVGTMEKEMLSNYAQLKAMIADNYASWMDSYTRNAAAAQAGISGTLSKSGISGAALNNALAEAQYDPKRLAAIQSLKDKQISDVTNLQQNYSNWYNNIIANKSSLTASEKQLADSVLQRKDQLETELNELKTKNLTDAYKPIIDVQAQKADALSKGETINAQQNKTINDYAAANPARKKDMLMYKLQESGTDIGNIDEQLLNDALAHGSYPEALAFLRNESHKRAISAQESMLELQKTGTTGSVGSWDGGAGGKTLSGPTTPEPVVWFDGMSQEAMQKGFDTHLSKWNNPEQTKTEMIAAGADEDMVAQLKVNTAVIPNSTWTGAPKKNTPSVLNTLQAIANWSVAQLTKQTGSAILWKLNSSVIQKLTPPLKDAVIKAYTASIGALGNIEAEAYAKRVAQAVMDLNPTDFDLMTQWDALLSNSAKEALTKPGVSGTTKALLQKIVQYGAKAIPIVAWAGAVGTTALWAIPLLIAVGSELVLNTPKVGDTVTKDRTTFVNDLIQNGVSLEEANRMADKEASYGTFNK